MPARTARYFKKLKKPPWNANMAVSNPPATTTVETKSGHVRRLQASLRLARKGVIVPSMETILYLKKCRPRRRTTRKESGPGARRPARRDLFYAIADFAVFHTVGEVNDQPDDQPNNQPHPGNSVQTSHKPQRDNNSHDGHEGNPRCPEGPLQVRPATPQNHHRRANNDKGQESTDAHHLPQAANGDKRSEDGGPKPGNCRGLPGSAETRVDIARPLPEQAVVGH